MFYCNELIFGIIPTNRFINIEPMNIISSDKEDGIGLLEMSCEEYYEKTQKLYIFSYFVNGAKWIK